MRTLRSTGQIKAFLFGLLVVLMLPAVSVAAQIPGACDGEMVTGNRLYLCANSIRDEFRQRSEHYRQNPREVFALAARWNSVYERAYLSLAGQPRSQSDIQMIKDQLEGLVNPIDWASDALLESVIKRYLTSLTAIMNFVGSAPATALKAFLRPSEIASDLDNLERSNGEVNAALLSVTEHLYRKDWSSLYSDALMRIPVPTEPAIRLP